MTLRRTLLGVGIALLAALGIVGWDERPKPGPPGDAKIAVWDVMPTDAEPLSSDIAACSAASRLVLRKLGRVEAIDGTGSAATCRYEIHLEGWPEGEDECILELAVKSIRGIATETLAARVALAYYLRRQGGVMTFAGPTTGRAFIALDARWCRWSSVVDGIRAVP